MPRVDLASFAARYLQAGLAVLPARRERKQPAVTSWKKYQDSLPTLDDIDGWFVKANPDALCIVCGVVSGNLEVLDFDQKAILYKEWAALVRDEAPGLFERLVIERSQSGGIHVLYRSTEPVGGNAVLAAEINDAVQATLIETRGEGGLILCAPTPGYELLQGQLHALPVLSGDEVETLRSAASALDRRTPTMILDTTPRTSKSEQDRPGDRFNREGDLRPILERHGWRRWRRGDNEYWTRPGKAAGVSATFNGECFFVHSSNAAPFEHQRGYSKFTAFTLLEHGGDFRKAAKAVRRERVTIVSSTEVADESPAVPRVVDPDPDPLPDHLTTAPGFIGMVIEHQLAVAPRPNRTLAFAAALCLQATLSARRVVESGGNRTNIIVIAVSPSASGKENGRQVNRRILTAAGLAHLEGPEDLASDAGLLSVLEEQPALLLQLDEIGRMLRSTGDAKRSPHLYNIPTAIMRLYTSAGTSHQGKAYADVSRRKRIDYPCVVIHGTTVPLHLSAGLTIDALTDGFLGRTLLILNEETPARQRPLTIPVPEQVIEIARWWGAFRPAAACRGAGFTPFGVECDPAAHGVFDHFGEEMDRRMKTEDPAGQALLGRAEEKARKLALIYACSASANHPADSREQRLRIDSEAATWGCELSVHLTERTLSFARRTIVSSPFEAMQNRVLEAIRRRGGRISRSQLTRDTQSMTVKERDAVLDNLAEAGRVCETFTMTTSKPSTHYELIND